jgi:hypothetical protein
MRRDRSPGGVTGIFYHPSFSRRSYLTAGRRLADFPGALGSLLQSPHAKLFQCPAVADELILLAHDPRLIPEVESDPF